MRFGDPSSTGSAATRWRGRGKHLIIGDDGAVHVYNADTGEQVWSADIDGTVRGIAAADGALILSTKEGEIHCLGEEGKAAAQVHAETKSPVTEPGSATDQWMMNTLRSAGIDRGFAVVVDDDAELASQLVRQTNLRVALIVDSEEIRDEIRQQLLATNTNLTVFEKDRLEDLPPSFANAVISDEALPDLHRILHPYSGQWLLPGNNAKAIDEALLAERGPEMTWQSDAEGLLGKAGQIPQAHRVIRGPFEMLWYGGPGPRRMTDRHIVNGPKPKAAGGRTIVVGAHDVMAFDAFNGAELWALPLRDACVRDREIRTSAQNVLSAGITFAVDEDTVRLDLGDGISLDLDVATGKPRRYYGAASPAKRFGLAKPRTFPIPLDDEQHLDNAVKAGDWGSVTLNPTADALELVLTAKHPEGRLLDRWEFFLDFRKLENQFGLYTKGAFQFTVYPHTEYERGAVNVFYKYFPRWQGRIPRPDPDEKGTRAAEAFAGAGPAHPPVRVAGIRETESSITTVRILWSDLQELVGAKPSSFGFAAALLLDDPAVDPIERARLFAGDSAPRINHGWPLFDLTSKTDENFETSIKSDLLVSAGDMPEVSDHLPPEKDLAAEKFPRYRIHPLTQRPTRRLFRPAYGCASPISAEDTAFFRSGSVAYYDYNDDTGVRNIFGVRPGCLYNSSILPAMGLVIYAERSSGLRL